MLVPIQISINMAAGNQQKKTSVTEFCYKSSQMIASLKELKNIKTALFLIQIP